MNKFDPAMRDDSRVLDAAFLAGMTPSRRGRPRSEAPKVEVKIRIDDNTVEHLRGGDRPIADAPPWAMVAIMDHATPNLPSRNYDATSRFFASLEFEEGWRDGGWMILSRGSLRLEFFPHPDLDPATSWFSCCLRLDNLDEFYDACLAAGVPEASSGAPRLHKPVLENNGLRIGALIDPDGTLLRLIQNA